MKKKGPVFKSLVCAVSLALTVSFPALASTDRPVLPLPSAEEIGPRCQQGLSDLGQQISALEKIQPQSEAGAAEFLKGWTVSRSKWKICRGRGTVKPGLARRQCAEKCRCLFHECSAFHYRYVPE